MSTTYSVHMKKHTSWLCAMLLGSALALAGCVTQPTQTSASNAASTSTTTAANGSLASAAGSLMSSLGVPAAGTASNAAGVLTYCAKNNLLNPDKATQMTDQLLGSLGLPTTQGSTAAAPTQDQGYLNGIAGMVVSPNGELFSLDQIKGNVKDKACDFILNNAKSFL